MIGMANDLRALGETITDRHLVLNLLQGLNKKYDHMKTFIMGRSPFPPSTSSATTSNSMRSRWKTRVRVKERARVTTTTTPSITVVAAAPLRGHPSTTLGLAPSSCGHGCTLLLSQCAHLHSSMPCLLYKGTMVPSTELHLHPCRHHQYNAPAAGCGPCLITLGECLGSTVTNQFLQHCNTPCYNFH
jgi:hypothetical protein